MCTSEPAEEVTGSQVVGSCQAHFSVVVPDALPAASPPHAARLRAAPAPRPRPSRPRRLIEVAAVARTAWRRWRAVGPVEGVLIRGSAFRVSNGRAPRTDAV